MNRRFDEGLTWSRCRCFSLLNKNVPKRQEYNSSSIVIKNDELNSKAYGNWTLQTDGSGKAWYLSKGKANKKRNKKKSLKTRMETDFEWKYTNEAAVSQVFLTWFIICHTQSINCRNIGDLSLSLCLSSPCPTRCNAHYPVTN